MSGSLASRMAAMIEAAITSVDRNGSDFWRSSFSRAMARYASLKETMPQIGSKSIRVPRSPPSQLMGRPTLRTCQDRCSATKRCSGDFTARGRCQKPTGFFCCMESCRFGPSHSQKSESRIRRTTGDAEAPMLNPSRCGYAGHRFRHGLVRDRLKCDRLSTPIPS